MITLDWDKFTSWSILVIEDEPDNATVIVGTLEYYGATVIWAEHGVQAFEHMQDNVPDLIICDISMPIMDGWEFFKLARENPAYAHIPIVAWSAHAMAGDKQRALDTGFDGYLTKPINVRTFLHDVQMAMKEAKTLQTAAASEATAQPEAAAQPEATAQSETATQPADPSQSTDEAQPEAAAKPAATAQAESSTQPSTSSQSTDTAQPPAAAQKANVAPATSSDSAPQE